MCRLASKLWRQRDDTIQEAVQEGDWTACPEQQHDVTGKTGLVVQRYQLMWKYGSQTWVGARLGALNEKFDTGARGMR